MPTANFRTEGAQNHRQTRMRATQEERGRGRDPHYFWETTKTTESAEDTEKKHRLSVNSVSSVVDILQNVNHLSLIRNKYLFYTKYLILGAAISASINCFGNKEPQMNADKRRCEIQLRRMNTAPKGAPALRALR